MNKFSFAAFAAIASAMGGVHAEQTQLQAGPVYKENETRGSFDMVMKPYPIPIETTTYVDFVFNLPDNLPDLFHVVFGEVINSQPRHLHHFVLTGCSQKIDPSLEGVAQSTFSEASERDCIIPLGGWAPGADMFGIADTDTGVIMGKGLGVEAIRLNVHYTDGAYEDESTETFKIATDGLRIHYTPDFRPYTSSARPLINVGFGPRQMQIPAGEKRFYISRTCKVNTSCKDADLNQLGGILNEFGISESDASNFLQGSELTCSSVKPFCNMGGEIGTFIKLLCPASCGFCGELEGGNPLASESFRVTGVNYHAHLLGREMYTTLLREEDSDETNNVAIQRDSDPFATKDLMVKDMKSKDFWIYDFQETIPLDYDYQPTPEDELMQGTEVKIGDKIQVTCVYDSTARTDSTRFYLSTYDEMCITTALVTFETPAQLMGGNNTALFGNLDIFTEMNLHTFACDDDEETDVYTGVLAEGEDGRDIWKDHPISDAEGCTFPNNPLSPGLYSTRNCPDQPQMGEGETYVCGDMKMMGDVQAGATCYGGTKDLADANDGTTEEDCVSGGGSWNPYTCENVNYWLEFEATLTLDTETVEFLVGSWYEPNCCIPNESSSSDEMETESESDLSVSAAPASQSVVTVAATAALAVLALAL